jgi:hypothetical protein
VARRFALGRFRQRRGRRLLGIGSGCFFRSHFQLKLP